MSTAVVSMIIKDRSGVLSPLYYTKMIEEFLNFCFQSLIRCCSLNSREVVMISMNRSSIGFSSVMVAIGFVGSYVNVKISNASYHTILQRVA